MLAPSDSAPGGGVTWHSKSRRRAVSASRRAAASRTGPDPDHSAGPSPSGAAGPPSPVVQEDLQLSRFPRGRLVEPAAPPRTRALHLVDAEVADPRVLTDA